MKGRAGVDWVVGLRLDGDKEAAEFGAHVFLGGHLFIRGAASRELFTSGECIAGFSEIGAWNMLGM